MKLGRTFPAVRRALEAAGRLEGAVYVERASMADERRLPVADVDPETVPYFSLIVVPGDTGTQPRGRPGGPRPGAGGAARGRASARARTGGSPPRSPTRWPRSITWSATRRTSTGCRSGPGCSGTPRATPSSSTGPGSPSTWPAAASGWPSSRVATPACSAWRRPSSRRPRIRRTPTWRCACCPESVRSRRSRPGRERRSAATSRCVSLSDRLKPWPVIERRLRAIAEADLVLAVYNPASRSRRDQLVEAQKILLETAARGPPGRGRPRRRPTRGVT